MLTDIWKDQKKYTYYRHQKSTPDIDKSRLTTGIATNDIQMSLWSVEMSLNAPSQKAGLDTFQRFVEVVVIIPRLLFLNIWLHSSSHSWDPSTIIQTMYRFVASFSKAGYLVSLKTIPSFDNQILNLRRIAHPSSPLISTKLPKEINRLQNSTLMTKLKTFFSFWSIIGQFVQSFASKAAVLHCQMKKN